MAYYNADAAVKIVGTFDCCISSAGSTGGHDGACDLVLVLEVVLVVLAIVIVAGANASGWTLVYWYL